MQTLKLDARRLPDLLVALMDWGPVWAPVETTPGSFTLQVLEDIVQARPEALRTVVPFKKLLLPASFTMMSGGFAGISDVETASEDTENRMQVFFGAHACDVHALKILDLLYLSNYVDPYYQAKRRKLLVVAYGSVVCSARRAVRQGGQPRLLRPRHVGASAVAPVARDVGVPGFRHRLQPQPVGRAGLRCGGIADKPDPTIPE